MPARIASGKNRRVQVVRTGKRKLFGRERKLVFLEWFAATCNVKFAAAKAGVAYQTVFKHRMKDAAFAEAWDRCLGQGYARVEAQMLETEVAAEAFEVDGDWDAPELQKIEPQLGLALLREHKKSLGEGASPFRAARKQGRRPKTASNAEIEVALVKRLVVYGVRVTAEGSSTEGK
jgi:hypothetical protein